MVGPPDHSRASGDAHPEKLSLQEVLKRLPLAPTLTIALIALTLVLALIAAIGIGKIYSARQDYEDAIARSYELQSSASRRESSRSCLTSSALTLCAISSPRTRSRYSKNAL